MLIKNTTYVQRILHRQHVLERVLHQNYLVLVKKPSLRKVVVLDNEEALEKRRNVKPINVKPINVKPINVKQREKPTESKK